MGITSKLSRIRTLVARGLLIVMILILLVTGFFWIRGIWRIDMVIWSGEADNTGWTAIAGEGHAVLGVNTHPGEARWTRGTVDRHTQGMNISTMLWLYVCGDPAPKRVFDAFVFQFAQGPDENPYSIVIFPLWLPFAVIGPVLLWWWVRRWRNRRRIARGHCVKCGYDLRASGERCPECGTVVRQVTQAN